MEQKIRNFELIVDSERVYPERLPKKKINKVSQNSSFCGMSFSTSKENKQSCANKFDRKLDKSKKRNKILSFI